MTISTTTSKVGYNGNGVTTAFSVPFLFLTNADLTVVLLSSTGVETTLTLSTHYTVTGAGNDSGGTLTMVAPPAVGERLTILREVALTQETDYISGDPFPAETHERALDRLVMIAQQLTEVVNRSLRFPVSDTASPELPTQSTRAGKLLAFDGSGELSAVVPSSDSSTVLRLDLSANTGAALVGAVQSGAGAVSRTVQAKLRDVVSVKDFGATGDGVTDDSAAFTAAGGSASPVQVRVPAGTYKLNSNPFTIGDYPSGSVTWIIEAGATFTGAGKLGDRVVYEGEQPDWYGAWEQSAGRDFANHDYTNNYVETTDTPTSLIAGLFAARTSTGTMARDHTAVFSAALNNNASFETRAWGGYFEATRTTTAAGATYGIEVDVVNTGSVAQITPYGQNAKQTIGIQLASGAELDLLSHASTSAAINIAYGLSQFNKGIVFQRDALVGADGSSGTATAIAFAKGHAMHWYATGGVRTTGIVSYASSAAAASTLQFQDNFTRVTNSGNAPLLQVNHPSSAVNGVIVGATVAGTSPVIYPDGSDTNLDLVLNGKGTGVIRFGTYTSGALSVTGYVTIKDYGGTTRRLLVG